ncbi:peptidoglycan-binding domain-containing protein [Paracoccus beibuensis]|uniref:peptidoglycan-binding domain-containing protein n=1 Tax=Paracoccus beibuensis TaxID=547602 RepID=UPI0022407CCF|nr:peptidoglycan-binding domain-containing protein [Paracoccus beibuensis]
MRIFLGAVTVTMAAARAMAQPGTPPPDLLVFDTIYNVPEVQDILVDADRNAVFAAVAPISPSGEALSDIVRWSLDPVRRAGLWPTGTLVSDLAVTETGLIYAAGQRGGSLRGKAPPAPRSGSVVSLDPDHPDAQPRLVVTYGDTEGQFSIPRFNQISVDGRGRIYLAAPTQFSVTVLPGRPEDLQPGTMMPRFLLQCGAPAQLSLVDAGGQVAYVASTIDGASLETGLLDGASASAPACFRVTNVYAHNEPPPTLSSVVHAVVQDDAGRADAVVALEPNTGVLHLLRLDANQRLSRNDWHDLGAAPGGLTLLSSSRDGSVIFVGGRSESSIQRYRREGDMLVRLGTLRTGRDLKQIEISADGSLAVLVMRDADRQDRIHLIHNPAALRDGDQPLKQGGETLRQVQSQLNELGYSAGPVDGILGPQTLHAIQQLELQGDTDGESADFGLKSRIDGVLLTRPSDGLSE